MCFWTFLSFSFVLIGLGVATYGIRQLLDVKATEYKPATCELVRAVGPEESCSTDSDRGNNGAGPREETCTYSCMYTMQSDVSGESEFDITGEANEGGCTEFSSSSPGHNGLLTRNCYAKIKDDKVNALSFGSQDEEAVGAYVVMGFGFVFAAIACCFVGVGGFMWKVEANQVAPVAHEEITNETPPSAQELEQPSTVTVRNGKETE